MGERRGGAPILGLARRLYILSDSGKVLSRTPVDIRLSALTENKEIRTRTTVEAALLSRPGVKLCVGVEDPFSGGPAVYLAMDAPRLDTLVRPV